MARLMRDGKPLSWHLYPPYPWKGTRKRAYSYMSRNRDTGTAVCIDEWGEVSKIEGGKGFYEGLKSYCSQGRTVYTKHLAAGRRWKSIVEDASRDPNADVIYRPGVGIIGFKFRATRKDIKGQGKGRAARSGALYNETAMGMYLEENVPPAEKLMAIREVSRLLGAGDYDTQGALGQATLSKFWTQNGLRKLWRLPDEITSLAQRYKVGGRAEVHGQEGMIYPTAYRRDLNSAYPSVVARGLPGGNLSYHSRNLHYADKAAVYGVWRIKVHEDIPHSPIPVRYWNDPESPISWRLDKGEELEYAGWLQEIDALMQTGRVSVEFQRGWAWDTLDKTLAPWVEQMTSLRNQNRDFNPTVASLIKQVTNAAIGRWGMSGGQWIIVQDADRDIELGDMPIELCDDIQHGDLTAMEIPSLWVRQVSDECSQALPHHWYSYVHMAVRMELWRAEEEEMRRGGILLASNFDSYTVLDPPLDQTSMWDWKLEKMGEVEIPYNRAVIYHDDEGMKHFSLPGMSGAMRMAVLVDHQRKRQEMGHALFHETRSEVAR